METTKKPFILLFTIFVIAVGAFYMYKNLYRYETGSFMGEANVNSKVNILTGSTYIKNTETLEWEEVTFAKKRILGEKIESINARLNEIQKSNNQIDPLKAEFLSLVKTLPNGKEKEWSRMNLKNLVEQSESLFHEETALQENLAELESQLNE